MTAIELLLLHMAATWALVGLIWTVQLVQYPSFAYVGSSEFRAFHEHHSARITWVVAPLMLLELLTALALVQSPPPGISTTMLWVGLGPIAVVWLSTAFVAVPLHMRLSARTLEARQALVSTNWIRTAAWTARGVWTLFVVPLVLEQV